MAKAKGKTTEAKEKKSVKVELEQFTCTDANGKKMKVSAPVDSLDDHAREALEGVYRHA